MFIFSNQTFAMALVFTPYLRNRISSNSYAKFGDDYVGSLKLSFDILILLKQMMM